MDSIPHLLAAGLKVKQIAGMADCSPMTVYRWAGGKGIKVKPDRRAQILAVLSDEPQSASEIAEAAGMSPMSARYHLRLMVMEGLARVNRSGSRTGRWHLTDGLSQ